MIPEGRVRHTTQCHMVLPYGVGTAMSHAEQCKHVLCCYDHAHLNKRGFGNGLIQRRRICHSLAAHRCACHFLGSWGSFRLLSRLLYCFSCACQYDAQGQFDEPKYFNLLFACEVLLGTEQGAHNHTIQTYQPMYLLS